MSEGVWSIGGKGQLTYSERHLCHRLFVHRKSPVDWPEVEFGPLRLEAGDKSPDLWHGYIYERIILKWVLQKLCLRT